MNLSEYVKKKNGIPIGHSNSLRNNLHRALGAKNFPVFWNYWNPIFGYYLGTKVFKPLKKTFPVGLSLILTFTFCGLVHDAVTTILRGQLSLFFGVWFLIMGIMVAISKQLNYDLSHLNWFYRAIVNIFLIAACLLLTIYSNTVFNFY